MTPRLELDALGSLQFERFCVELLALGEAVDRRPWGFSRFLPDGVSVPGARELPGATLVLAIWLRGSATSPEGPARLAAIAADGVAECPEPPRSLLVLTNVAPASAALPAGVEAMVLGPAELWELLRARPALRYRVPSVLGVADLSQLVPADAAARSTADVDAAAALARIFVPTGAYARALAVLERHRFVVLSGPPEMGKTAIARMLGLAALTDGWEVHECVRPDELWSRFARDRRQVFVADDAFGSTEYRPDAAEHWALELDRVLRGLDDGHRLIWTSRPAPLKAGLRRIHREHGVERFPQPAEVGVDATDLAIEEKALILFRHAKAAGLPEAAVDLVQAHGWEIVSHAHFTPERIRRFVAGRLVDLAGQNEPRLAAAIAAEIREPTTAMASSYRSLAPDHRAVLLALLDTPPGPVPERELAAAVRRHSPTGLARPAAEVVDRLADHFLRVLPPESVTWVHPSWRDLVIEELAGDAPARRAFLAACGIHGVALALSSAGGARGTRTLPLLLEDADWDALADRLARLVPTLDAPEVTVLLAALGEARGSAQDGARAELAALASETLERLARTWSDGHTPVAVGLLAAWAALAQTLPELPSAPAAVFAESWIELLPTEPIDLSSGPAVAAVDDWLALAELLHAYAPELLDGFGFPAAHRDLLRVVVTAAERLAPQESEPAAGVVRLLRRVARLEPRLALEALAAAHRLQRRARPPTVEPEPQWRELSPELERLLDLPLARSGREQELVARVLRDL